MASTLTLQSVIDWCRTQPGIKGQPLTSMLGLTNEPGLSMCNNVMQELFCSPNNWRFNRANLAPGGGAGSAFQAAFTTVAYQQDYVISGASAEVVGVGITQINALFSGSPGISGSGATVTVNTGDFGPHGFIPGQNVIIRNVQNVGFNGTFPITGTPDSTHFTYANATLGISGGPGITDMGWLESCTFQDYSSSGTVKPVHDVETVFALRPESIIQNPIQVCFLSEDVNHSTVTIRTWPVPGSQIWGIQIPYQSKCPVFSSLGQTWGPWPDELGYVVRAGVKWQAFLTCSDPRADIEWQKFQAAIVKALDIKQQEKRGESYFPDLPILRGG